MSRVTVLYSRNRSTSGSISESTLECFRYSVGSVWISVEPSRCSSSSYCRSVAVSLSNMSVHGFLTDRSAFSICISAFLAFLHSCILAFLHSCISAFLHFLHSCIPAFLAFLHFCTLA